MFDLRTEFEKNVNLYERKYVGKFNKVAISGILEDDFQICCEVTFEVNYKAKIKSKRLSDAEDVIVVKTNAQTLNRLGTSYIKGKMVIVFGEFKSQNIIGEDGKNHLTLFIFANYIQLLEGELADKYKYLNFIYLNGFLCRKPTYRLTPSYIGITDLFMAVNEQEYSAYIPCISWKSTAVYAANRLKIGSHIELLGRIQSREYKKIIPNSEIQIKIAYEVSIFSIRKLW